MLKVKKLIIKQPGHGYIESGKSVSFILDLILIFISARFYFRMLH